MFANTCTFETVQLNNAYAIHPPCSRFIVKFGEWSSIYSLYSTHIRMQFQSEPAAQVGKAYLSVRLKTRTVACNNTMDEP